MKTLNFSLSLLGLCLSVIAAGQGKALSDHPADLLKGRVSGVYVTSSDGSLGSTPDVLVRGLNSAFGLNEPLWVVDGAIMSSEEGMRYLSAYDIKEIKVLKDISETARYGNKGANGVIVISTQSPESSADELKLNTNAGISIPQAGGFAPAFNHSHHLSLGKAKEGSEYYVSLHYRGLQGVMGEKSNNGGLMMKFNTNPGRTVSFGAVFAGSLGNGKSYSVEDPLYGASSLMLSKRYPSLTPDSEQAWLSDYDNDNERYHAAADVWLKVNILRGLSLKLNGGVDFDKLKKGIWYGPGTTVGKAVNGLVTVTDDATLNYNADLVLEFDRYFGTGHHLNASLSGNADGRRNSFGKMTGTDFFSPALRYNGLSIMGGTAPICTYTNLLTTLGGKLSLEYSYSDIAGVQALLCCQSPSSYGSEKVLLYPSANVWLDLRNLFFKNSSVVNSLKLHGGYGSAGREQYLPYDAISSVMTAEYVQAPQDAKSFFYSFDRARSSEVNAGIKLDMLSNRLSFDAVLYSKKTEETFNEYCCGKSGNKYWIKSDKSVVFSRTAEIAARGAEFSLSGVVLKKTGADLKLSGFFSMSENYYKSIPEDCYKGTAVAEDFFCNVNVKYGNPGNLAGYDLSQNPDKRVILGNPMPSMMTGIRACGHVGGFFYDLSADASLGRSIANLNELYASAQAKLSSQFVSKADYLRLSLLTLGYEFSFNKCFLKGLQLKLEGGNVLLASSYSGWNPDVNSFGVNSLSAGLDWASFPSLATVVFGVVMKFGK